jgi:hypothetical protein
VKHAISTGTGSADRRAIRNICLYYLKSAIVTVLLQIGAASDGEIVESPNLPPFAKQPIYQMATNKSGASSHDIQSIQVFLRLIG